MPRPEYIPFHRRLGVMSLALGWGGVMGYQTLRNIIRYGPQKILGAKTRDTRPAALDDPELGTHHFAKLKDITLHYVSKGPSDKPLLLFLHGFPELWYSWRYQLKGLSNEYRVVAVDMRGYGESDKPEGIEDYHMSKLTDDIQQLIEHLGYDKCYLVGHDWGGFVAWMFAAKHPDLVEKLVICNVPNPFASAKQIQRSVSQLRKSWYVFLFQLPYFPEYVLGFNDFAFVKPVGYRSIGERIPHFTKEDMEVFKYTFSKFADRTAPINYYRALMRYKFERLPSNKVKCPTMLIWGTLDGFSDDETVEGSKHYAIGDFHLCYVTGAGHFVQQDKPEIVNEHIQNFLEGKNPSGIFAAKM